MKQVQFYVLNNKDNIHEQACDLAEKAWRLGKRVLIACETEQQALEIDELLWMKEPDSFVPHNLSGETTQYPTPIEISWKGKRNAQRRDLLVSLQVQIPEFIASFNQVIEFVPVDETEKIQARERYKQYRQQGWQLSTEQTNS